MKTKPLDAPTAARAMRMTEKQVRKHATYDSATDTVQVPVFIWNQVEFERARAEFGRAAAAALRPALERMNQALIALGRFSRRS